jgi:hypothetical protein
MEHARERRQVLAMSLIALGAGVRLRIGVNFISRERVKRGLGGSVWESNVTTSWDFKDLRGILRSIGRPKERPETVNVP